MKSVSAFLFVIMLFLTSCSNKQNETETTIVTDDPTSSIDDLNVLTEPEEVNGWELLFDGKTTKGFRNYQKGQVEGWQVEDGILFTSGGNDDIITDKQFENFELSVEWKIESGGNSGIFYFVDENSEFINTHETGPEYQIIDDENYPQQLTDKQKTGAVSDVMAPVEFLTHEPGEWNYTKILVDDGHIEHWLNDELIVKYDMESMDWIKQVDESKFDSDIYAKLRKGHIGFQDHGGPVSFRNIKIREL
ncbi:MAG: DUF1080 domain-containing protein [Balneolales bacterium]